MLQYFAGSELQVEVSISIKPGVLDRLWVNKLLETLIDMLVFIDIILYGSYYHFKRGG
jgi:hypothetical protein